MPLGLADSVAVTRARRSPLRWAHPTGAARHGRSRLRSAPPIASIAVCSAMSEALIAVESAVPSPRRSESGIQRACLLERFCFHVGALAVGGREAGSCAKVLPPVAISASTRMYSAKQRRGAPPARAFIWQRARRVVRASSHLRRGRPFRSEAPVSVSASRRESCRCATTYRQAGAGS